jgi:zinc-ribbon domain
MKTVWRVIAIVIVVGIVAALVSFAFFRPFGLGNILMMNRGPRLFFGRMYFGPGIFGFGFPLITLVVIGLLVWIGLSLIREPARPQVEPPAIVQNCVHCGKPLQAGWMTCPYCGEKI